MIEILRGAQPFPQPSPARNPGGDCFACSLTAAVRCLFPDKPVAFETVWEAFLHTNPDGSKHLSNTWPTMRSAIYALSAADFAFETITDLVLPEVNLDHWSYAWGLQIPDNTFAYRLEAWLAAGWLALAEMNYAGAGHYTGDRQNHIDHFVLLDGVRHYWKQHDAVEGASFLTHDVHVVCSARGAYWISARDLLVKHGTAALTLVRKDLRSHPRQVSCG